MKILRTSLTIIIVFGLLSFLPITGHTHAQDYAYQEDFEDGLAQGWILEPGWKVDMDRSNYILAGNGHVWARSNQSFSEDYRLSFRLKLLEGTIHLVYRLGDVGRYFIGFTEGGTYLSKQYWPDDFRPDLIESHTPHSTNTWYSIEIIGQGDTLEFMVNGEQEWAYIDPQPLQNSSFAFETLDGSQAYIDDIAVELFTTTSPAPDLPNPSELSWIRLGGPLGGLGYDIRMLPGNPDVLFVTDAWAGAFTSRDGGQSWQPSSNGITTRTGPSGEAIPVFSLTVDPNNPNILWAGTQFRRGIFKSTDGGQTWIKMDNGIIESDGISFRGFTVDPNNSDIVYAAAEISSWTWFGDSREHIGREFDRTGGVIYKTTNGGQSWNAVWRGENLARYIWINPQDTNIIYISTGIFDREAANSDPEKGIPGGEGVLKSTDGGLTWTHANNGLDNLYVGSLFMHPTRPEILLAGTGNNQYQTGAGVYLSQDGGNSWVQTLATGDAITSVEIASSDPNIAYAGSRSTVYRSEDGGSSWKKVSSSEDAWGAPGVQTGFPIDFQVDPRNADRIFTNAYGGGAFVSEDGGRTWQDASKGYTGAQVRDLAVNPYAPSHLVAAARSGIFASYDGGTNWTGINPPNIDSLEWNVIGIDSSNPQHFIGGLNVQGTLANSLDGGSTWKAVKSAQGGNIGWRAIAFAPSDTQVVYAGSAGFYSAGIFSPAQAGMGVFVSQDGGNYWSPANDSLTQDAHVSALAVHPANPQVVYAATTNHGLLMTSNAGTLWMESQKGLPPGSMVISLRISPFDPYIIFAGLERGGVYRSLDGGLSWSNTSSGLNPEASVTDVLFDPTNPDVLYLADLFSGVYRTSDGGSTWTALNTGLLSRSVNALALSSDGMHLYAATEGSGVYRLDFTGVSPQPVQPIPTNQPTVKPSPIVPAGQPTGKPSPTIPASPVSNPQATGNTPIPSSAKPGICGSIVMLPLTFLGIAWWRSVKKKTGDGKTQA